MEKTKRLVLSQLSPEAKQMVNHFDLRFAETLNLITKKLNEQFKNKIMEKRKIELTIETATRWYNGCDAELKALAVGTFPELKKKELPKTWEELKVIYGYYVDYSSKIILIEKSIEAESIMMNKNIFATKEQAEASIALSQLSQLREVYRNGWVPDWSDNKSKYCIRFFKKQIEIVAFTNINYFLSFQDQETCNLFLENFRDLIEQAKPLMS